MKNFPCYIHWFKKMLYYNYVQKKLFRKHIFFNIVFTFLRRDNFIASLSFQDLCIFSMPSLLLASQLCVCLNETTKNLQKHRCKVKVIYFVADWFLIHLSCSCQKEIIATFLLLVGGKKRKIVLDVMVMQTFHATNASIRKLFSDTECLT